MLISRANFREFRIIHSTPINEYDFSITIDLEFGNSSQHIFDKRVLVLVTLLRRSDGPFFVEGDGVVFSGRIFSDIEAAALKSYFTVIKDQNCW